MVETYASLHNHSEYSNALLSFTDSINKIPKMLKWCYENGLYGMALTDHEGVSGYVELEQEANKLPKDRPFKYIFGNEIYLINSNAWNSLGETDEKVDFYHFLLIALDEIGVKQIYELSSRAWLRSKMYKGLRRRPTFYEDIAEVIGTNPGHVIGSTACLGGELPHIILSGNLNKAINFVTKWETIFGKNNFFLECQPCYADNDEQIQVNQMLSWVHEKTNTPLIVTTDSHYLTADQREIHAAFLRSKDGGDSREPDKFYATTHFFTPDELRQMLYKSGFDDDTIDMMFQNTIDIADRVQPFSLKQTTQVPSLPELPEFSIKNYYKKYYDKFPYIRYYATSKDKFEQYYYYKIEQGLHDYAPDDIEHYLEQINTEMEQVKGLGEIFDNQRMSDYFTVVQKVVDLIWSEGDSLVGIGRGSAGAYVTNKLLGITGIDPLLPEINDFYPWWRFCSVARSDSIFDIDIDIQSFKKDKIINAIKNYFGERRVCQVVTWSKLSAKTAIERACRGLGIPDDVSAYFRSLVPVKRNAIYSLNDCLYGNKEKDREKVNGFKAELDAYPGLLETALAFEGIIITSGVHAGALNVLKSDFTDTGALMVSNNGAIINQFDLHHGEYCGQLKFDLLSIDALENIRTCMDLLISHGKMEWQGSLRDTYNHYLAYDVIEKDNKEMWGLLPNMTAAFQYDSRAGKEALNKIGATNIVDLTLANGLMRLAVPNGEQPMDMYVRYRNNIQDWYDDMTAYGLTQEEQEIYKRLLGKYSGLCISQETMMVALMDDEVCKFTLKEADKARKAVAKKNEEALKETEERLYAKGKENGRSQTFLDYLWKVQIEMSKSYAFAFSHSHEYSTECLQELNLYWKYPKVYWNTAVVTTQSQTEDERDGSAAINYGKICQSIYKAKSNSINVLPPDINKSAIAFEPDESTDSIIFGLGAISGINVQIAEQIIVNRPYENFADFCNKNSYKGSLVTPSKFIQLIKAGCFDEFNPNRIKIMKQYFVLSNQKPEKLTMQNMNSIKSVMKLPKEIFGAYNFYKYITQKRFYFGPHPKFKSKKLYWLDDKAIRYFNTNCSEAINGTDYWEEDDKIVVVDKAIEKILKPKIDVVKDYINTPEFIDEYYKSTLRSKFNEALPNQDPNHWSMETVSYYSGEHEMHNIDYDRYNLTHFADIPAEPEFVERTSRGRTWKQFDLYAICGTVVAKNDNNHYFSLLTPDNEVVNCKLHRGAYAAYKAQYSEVIDGKKTVIEKPWLSRGTMLIVSGYRRGEEFVCKKYANSIYQHQLQKVLSINEDGETIIQSERLGGEE